ncbi:MAG: DUF2934 domain-containing protein [Acidobacteriota bacterium]|nr:DUF2934 domain-containing protein [Acidobacteriota bacterium]
MPTRSRARGKHHQVAVVTEPEAGIVETAAEVLYDRDAIARLAYSYWEARGRQGGSEAEDWLRAEKEFANQWKIAGNR